MYLLPIHVPIYRDGDSKYLTTEWWRALELLRDSLRGQLGEIVVAAPWVPVAAITTGQKLVLPPPDCGISLRPNFDLRCRARDFWSRHRARWHHDLLSLARQADVVHAGLDDVYRPITFEGFRVGVRLGKPSLFVQDTDIVVQQRQLSAHAGAVQRSRAMAYGWIYERMCRWGVARADLSLLKGSNLMARYGGYARNAKEFHDTSFSVRDIIADDLLERRLARLARRGPVRFVYCGRLTEYKGLSLSLSILARVRELGATAQLDIIGDGPQRSELERQANLLRITGQVSFLGALPYDSALIARLATYDALLFTPKAEDTPRMIFDGYAAGLPTVAFDVPYVQERCRQDQAAALLPFENLEQSANTLAEICQQPERLLPLARNARKAAEYHCAESWYARRAAWTLEAIEKHKHLMALEAAA
jgi:glycosyltransferase involved in cell wall biosynthesis